VKPDRSLPSIAAGSLLLTLASCASTSVQFSGDRPADGLCQREGQNVSALVLWGTQWRPDQKDIPDREAAAELGLSEYFTKSGCFSSVQVVRRVPMVAFTLETAREAVQSADAVNARVLIVTVHELGPVIKLLSSAAPLAGGTEVVLGFQYFELTAPGRAREFAVHWTNGGPGVLKGVATLPVDMQAALAASLGPAQR
jgi:hypothetical protein